MILMGILLTVSSVCSAIHIVYFEVGLQCGGEKGCELRRYLSSRFVSTIRYKNNELIFKLLRHLH
jgi:hypothetical protein